MPPHTHPLMTLRASTGHPVEIALVAVPGAGVKWHAPPVPADCTIEEAAPEPLDEGIGGSTRQRFLVTVSTPGVRELTFEYRRPWEPVVRAVQPVVLDVR